MKQNFCTKKEKQPTLYRCDTCGDRECRRKWRVCCWLHCGKWKPELLPLEKVPVKAGDTDE